MIERLKTGAVLFLLILFSWRQASLAFVVAPTHHIRSTYATPVTINRLSFSQSRIQQRTCIRASSTSDTEASPPDEKELLSDKERALGILVLLSVPLSWGTYSPVVRYLYELQPPVPGFVFSGTYYAVAALTLLTLSSLSNDESDDDLVTENQTMPLIGGLELGSYLFFANGLQILGLKTVPADRAGFLVQLTTVMVPVVQAALTGNVSSIPMPTWLACLLAFGGVIIMGLDGKEAALFDTSDGGFLSSFSSTLMSFTQGDLLIVLAAFIYTLHVVRLGKYAKETTPIKLAASKATTEAFLSVGLVALLMAVGASGGDGSTGILAYAQETGRDISTFFVTISDGISSGAIPTSQLLPAVGATLWTALVTCAYTIYAQSFGQRRVSPTEANLIYTVQPIFTALFAWVLLGETLGPAGFVGAGLIGSAVYTVATMTK